MVLSLPDILAAPFGRANKQSLVSRSVEHETDGREMGSEDFTHGTEGDSSSGQADEASIAGMWLVDGIGILVAELLEYGLNPLIVFGGSKLAYQAF